MKKENKYTQGVIHLLASVGGKENIISITHCVTRMRFKLKDWNLIDKDAIKKSDYSKGIVEAPGEFQVVIGTDVESFYKVFVNTNGFDEDGNPITGKKSLQNFETKTTSRNENGKWSFKIWCKNALSFVVRTFAPLIPVLIAYGLIYTIDAFLVINWNGANSAAIDAGKFWAELHSIIKVTLDGIVLFVTIAIGFTTFKAMKGNGLYGLAIALILTLPSLTQIGQIDNGKDIIGQLPGWELIPGVIYPWKISFAGLIIPLLLICILGAYIERWTGNIKNSTAKMLLQPLAVVFGTSLIGIFLVGPAGLFFTIYLGKGISWLGTNHIAKYMGVPIIGAFYGIMTAFGLHKAMTPLLLQDLATMGGSLLFPILILNAVAQGVAALAFTMQYRKLKQIKDVGIPSAVTAIVGGITEPSIYGITLKFLYPIIAAGIGVFSGLLLIVASNSFATVGTFSIFGILMFWENPPEILGVTTWAGGGMLWGSVGVAITIVVTFISTILLGNIKSFKIRTKNILLTEYPDSKDIIENIRLTKKVKTNDKKVKVK